MAMYQVIVMGGTTESYPGDVRPDVTGMLKGVTDHLDPAFFDVHWVGYPADYGTKMPYAQSVAKGKQALLDKMASLPPEKPVLGLFYSQSCAFGVELLLEKRRGMHVDLPYYAAFCLGNPVRRRGSSIGPYAPAVGSYGIAGEATVEADGSVFDVICPGDPITESPRDAMLRSVADFTAWMSASTLEEWGDDVARKIRSRGFQNATLDSKGLWNGLRRMAEAGAAVSRYLPWHPLLNRAGGRHTLYSGEYVRINGKTMPYTHSQRMALAMNELVGA